MNEFEFDEFADDAQHYANIERFQEMQRSAGATYESDYEGGNKFVLKSIPEVLLELVMTQSMEKCFYLLVSFAHMCSYARGSLEANLNLQRITHYRSKFHYRGMLGFVPEHLLENPPTRFSPWYIVNGPAYVNQLANLCFVVGVEGIISWTLWKLKVLVVGILLWVLVHLVWNSTFVLFGKPNVFHGYQAKQWFHMNSKFWLGAYSMYLLALNVERLTDNYTYRGPMHIVGIHTETGAAPLSDYLVSLPDEFKVKKKDGLEGSADRFLQNLNVLKDRSNLGQLDIDEHRVMLDVAWGGPWGCPKQPKKHCQATVELEDSIGMTKRDTAVWIADAKVLKHPVKFPHDNRSKSKASTQASPLNGITKWAPCHRPVCPIEWRELDLQQYQFHQVDCLVDTIEVEKRRGNVSEVPFLHLDMVTESTCEASHPDGFSREAILCAARHFEKSFDNVTGTYKHPSTHRYRKPNKSTESVRTLMGDCNTCSVAQVPSSENLRQQTLAICFGLGMFFLAGWAVLAFFTYVWGWNQAPPEELQLELYPTGPPSMWQFVGFYYAVFGT